MVEVTVMQLDGYQRVGIITSQKRIIHSREKHGML